MQKGAKSAAVAVGRSEGPPPLQTPIACEAKHEEKGRKEGGRSSNDKGNNETGLEAMERLRFLASLRLAGTAQTEGGGTTITTYLDNNH